MDARSLNQKEIEHFQNLSTTWWDEEGPFRILHAITPLRMAFIKEKIEIGFRRIEASSSPLKGLRILDVGCGGGLLCEPLARLGANVTGIDPIEENISVAKNHADAMDLSIDYRACTIEDLTKDIGLFDVIIASEIVEHVDHPYEFIKICTEHLQEKGGIIVTTFNKTIKSYLLGIVAAEHILGWAPKGTHSWDKFMKPENLSHHLSDLGFKDQELSGLCYNPLKREWGLSSSTDVNYFLWAFRQK